MKPVQLSWDPEAMKANGLNREHLLSYGRPPADVMREISEFLTATSYKRPIMVTDNPLFDGQFVNHYMWEYLGSNPFGWSAKRIGDMWMGISSVYKFYDKNLGYYHAGEGKYEPIDDWHSLIKTPHTHNALDDAMGNAEALRTMAEMYHLEIPI
ncbi:MAG: hypothetical protein ABL876_00240 [Chitinophagaceae bacterium]